MNNINKTEKMYDLLVQYDVRNKNVVRDRIKSENITTAIVTDTYFVTNNINSVEVARIKAAMEECNVEEKGKIYRCKFSATKAHTIIKPTESKKHVKTNNTPDVALEAKNKRKNAKKQAFDARKKYAEKSNDSKKKSMNGRRAKRTYMKDTKKGVTLATIMHSRAHNTTDHQNKVRKIAERAGKFVINSEKRARNLAHAQKSISNKNRKAVQTIANLKNAA